MQPMKKISKKNMFPLLIGLVGIIIIVLPGIFGASSEAKQSKTESSLQNDIDLYAQKLETRIKNLCESCYGVGNVSVMITFEGGFEYEYAKNIESADNSYGNTKKEEILVIGQGSGQKCIVIREKPPSIAGVGIVCSGARDENTKRELVMLVSSALNIGTNKIYITEAS